MRMVVLYGEETNLYTVQNIFKILKRHFRIFSILCLIKTRYSLITACPMKLTIRFRDARERWMGNGKFADLRSEFGCWSVSLGFLVAREEPESVMYVRSRARMGMGGNILVAADM